MRLSEVHRVYLDRCLRDGSVWSTFPHDISPFDLEQMGLLRIVSDVSAFGAEPLTYLYACFELTNKGREVAEQILAPMGEW